MVRPTLGSETRLVYVEVCSLASLFVSRNVSFGTVPYVEKRGSQSAIIIYFPLEGHAGQGGLRVFAGEGT